MWVIDAVIDSFCVYSSKHPIRFRLRPTLKDPDDEFVLEAAVSNQAEFIVTHNIQDFKGAMAYGIRVVTPGEFLKIIGVWQ